MTVKNPKIDEYIKKEGVWTEEYNLGREIILGCGLDEELKWYEPCYTFEGKVILIMHGFKDYFALNFFKGSLLNDPNKMLVQQSKNSSATRQLRFNSVEEIIEAKSVIREYIFEAIEIERAGLKADYSINKEIIIFDELQAFFDEDTEFEKAFRSLTIGRQRGYILYFDSAKQSKTKTSRIKKYKDHILEGKGMNDY